MATLFIVGVTIILATAVISAIYYRRIARPVTGYDFAVVAVLLGVGLVLMNWSVGTLFVEWWSR